MKILLVEDDLMVAELVRKTLNDAGYEVTLALDGESALDYITKFDYHLFIFDIMLPGINGINLCNHCKSKKIATPILMLTALSTTDNIIHGLDSGADDYLTKPFKIAELLARIRSLLRRGTAVNHELKTEINTLRYADVLMNLDEKSVQRNGAIIDFTVTEFRLLEYFLKNPRRVVSRIDILENVWGYDFTMNTKVVDVYVNYLRKKLEANDRTKLIQTVVGMGYILREEA